MSLTIGQYVYVVASERYREVAKVIGFREDRPDLVDVRYLHTFRDSSHIERTYYKRIIEPVTDLRELIECVSLDFEVPK